jgi:hypothetical protein
MSAKKARQHLAVFWQFRWHLLATAVALALWDTPFLLPFRLFVVMVHEVCHGAAALLTGGDFWSRFNAGPDQQAWYYDELARVFSVRRPGPAADELCGTVARLRELAILTRHQ